MCLRLTAARKHSRPVLSEVCPLLYKTVENRAVHVCLSLLLKEFNTCKPILSS